MSKLLSLLMVISIYLDNLVTIKRRGSDQIDLVPQLEARQLCTENAS